MTQDEIMDTARQAGFVVTHIGDPIGTNYAMIEAFAKLVAAKEREACAKVCDAEFWHATKRDGSSAGVAAGNCAEAIRARGKA